MSSAFHWWDRLEAMRPVLLKLLQQLLGPLLELAIFRCPYGIQRGIEHSLEFRLGVLGAIHLEERLRQEEMRRRAVRVVLERAAEVLHGALVAAAKQAWHLRIPAPERPIGGALLVARIQAQDGFESLLDVPSIAKAGPQA